MGRRLALGGVVLAVVGLACGSSDSSTPKNAIDTTPAIDDVIYQSGATDEALVSVLGIAPTADDGSAAALTSPMSGATVSAAAITTITWSPGSARSDSKPMFRWSDVTRALGAPREASAHGVPNTGLVYLIWFSNSDTPQLLRVFTTVPELVLDDTMRAGLAGATQPLTVKLVTARVENNDLVGGPFVPATPETLTITP